VICTFIEKQYPNTHEHTPLAMSQMTHYKHANVLRQLEKDHKEVWTYDTPEKKKKPHGRKQKKKKEESTYEALVHFIRTGHIFYIAAILVVLAHPVSLALINLGIFSNPWLAHSHLQNFPSHETMVKLTLDDIISSQGSGTSKKCMEEEFVSYPKKIREACEKSKLVGTGECVLSPPGSNETNTAFEDVRDYLRSMNCTSPAMIDVVSMEVGRYRDMAMGILMTPFNTFHSLLYYTLLAGIHLYYHRGNWQAISITAMLYAICLFSSYLPEKSRLNVPAMIVWLSNWSLGNPVVTFMVNPLNGMWGWSQVVLFFICSCAGVSFATNQKNENIADVFVHGWNELGSLQIILWWTMRMYFTVYIEHMLPEECNRDVIKILFFAGRTCLTFPWVYWKLFDRHGNIDHIVAWAINLVVYLCFQYYIVYQKENIFFASYHVSMASDYMNTYLVNLVAVLQE
jgi:hypothetical protein